MVIEDKHDGISIATIATCWKISLRDGRQKYFTDCERDLLIDNVLYSSKGAFAAGVVESNVLLGVDNFRIEGVLDSDEIDVKDLLGGKYDLAMITMFYANYMESEPRITFIKSGYLSQITVKDSKFYAEVVGVKVKHRTQIGEYFSHSCRASFCDSRCKLDSSYYKYSGEVSESFDVSSFLDIKNIKKAGCYDGGVLRFNTGDNSYRGFTVSKYYDGHFHFSVPAEFKIKKGDSYQVVVGCDKSFDTCLNKFNNSKNFRGEPYMYSVKRTIGSI